MNKPSQIHQFSTDISLGDAVSNHILDTAKTLNDAGYSSKVFCENPAPADVGYPIYPIDSYENEASIDSILFVHFTICYPQQMMVRLKKLHNKKVLVYHNITPHVYFYGINEGSYHAAQLGRQQLRFLASFIDTAIGDSSYNCAELRANGWETVYQLPISFDTARLDTKPSSRVMNWGEEGTNILFVGRIAPNKKFEDLLLTYYYVKNRVLPDARLVLVGSDSGMQSYAGYLQAIIKRLQLSDVHITGHVSISELVAYYRTASIYLSMSEHEGFGVPLLESIYFDVPVLAYKSTAVPETLAGRGVLFTEKRYDAVAELIGTLVNDKELHQQIVTNQRSLLKNYSYKSFQEKLLTIVDSVANGAPTNI